MDASGEFCIAEKTEGRNDRGTVLPASYLLHIPAPEFSTEDLHKDWLSWDFEDFLQGLRALAKKHGNVIAHQTIYIELKPRPAFPLRAQPSQ